MNGVVLYPTGWAAGFGVIKGLVRSPDHAVMDMPTQSCPGAGLRAGSRPIWGFPLTH